ncbi:hypothetical protein [Rhizobium sp. CF142]|uniref:hypothetical protein n=1 Tax=Rhizobium sp. CF142 TaxID=1144314 RepID=UPI00026F0082|nr:hypothetical protein [Rhizobium sp. CF142]EJJ29814.1 hypothetical protein PMI11_01877 [Rhizobium sp. CF142]
MPLSLEARMQMIGPISEDHAETVRPTVEAWAARAENLAIFCNKALSPETSPITAFVSSEILWRKPS